MECNMGSPRGANCAETFTKRYNNYKGGLKSKYSSSEGKLFKMLNDDQILDKNLFSIDE